MVLWKVIRWAVSFVCGFPLLLKLLLILLLPAPMLIVPLNFTVLLGPIFCSIYFSNSPLNKKQGKKSAAMAFRNSYLIYHALFVVLYGLAAWSACTVSDLAESYGM